MTSAARIRFIGVASLIASLLLVAANASANATVDAGAPNGSDDTATIQGLLNQGYIVSLRAGLTYRITRRLDVTVGGSGIIASGTPATLYMTTTFNNVDPLTMFDTTVRSDSIAIRAERVNGLRFENFRIQKQHIDGTYVSALWLRGVTNANIVGLEAWGFSLGPIIALDSVNGATIRGCIIRDSWASTAVTTKFPQLTGIVIDDNKLSSGGNAIGSTGVVISNNTISRLRFKKSLFDTPRSVFGMGAGVTGYQTDAITVVGGPVTGNGWNTTIIGNVLEVAGEGVDNFGTRTLIRNNRVRDIYDWGLKFVHGAKDSLALENDLVGAGNGSFTVAGTSGTLGNTFGQLLRDNKISKVGSYAAYCGPSVATGFRIHETCPTTPAASAFHLMPNGGTSNSGGVPSFTMMFGNVITSATDDLRMAYLLRVEAYARDSLFLGNTFANNTGRTITSPIDQLATGTMIDNSTMALVHADIDGNGLRDWFVHWRASGQNRLYRQNSNGTFTPSTNRISQTAINGSPDNTMSGDFNGDGRGDVLFHWKGDGTNRMYLGSSIGTFTEVLSPISPSAINSSADSVIVGDYNGDGRSDLLFYWKSPGTNRFYYGTAGGGFTEYLNPIEATAINSSPDRVIVGDYDGDGKSDLLFYWKRDGSNRFFFGTGSGTLAFANSPISATAINSSPDNVLVYDANRDGRDDLMFWWKSGELRRLFLGQVNRTFSQ